jgi:hypothetical protein
MYTHILHLFKHLLHLCQLKNPLWLGASFVNLRVATVVPYSQYAIILINDDSHLVISFVYVSLLMTFTNKNLMFRWASRVQ